MESKKSLLFCAVSTLLLLLLDKMKKKPLLPSSHLVLNTINVCLLLETLLIDILLLYVQNTLVLIPVCGHKTCPKNHELYLATLSGDVICDVLLI